MLSFCSVGVVPSVRPYLGDEMSFAIDVTVTRKLLNTLKQNSAAVYLAETVVRPVISESSGMAHLCDICDVIDAQGLFTRVVLKEYTELGASIQGRIPRGEHTSEAESFLEYMNMVATKQPGVDIAPGYKGQYMATAYMFIAVSERLRTEGAEPYLKHLRWLRSQGYQRVYIAARDVNISATKAIANSARIYKIASKELTQTFKAPFRHQGRTEVRENILIEMMLLDESTNSIL